MVFSQNGLHEIMFKSRKYFLPFEFHLHLLGHPKKEQLVGLGMNLEQVNLLFRSAT